MKVYEASIHYTLVRSGHEARLYLTKLQQILRYLGVSRANMEEGNMRCEPNVSLRPVPRYRPSAGEDRSGARG